MKKILMGIFTALFIGCLGVSFSSRNVCAAEDYGFEVMGQAVTSSYSNNDSQGWSYDAATSTLNLTDGEKLTAAFKDFIENGDVVGNSKYVKKGYESYNRSMNYYAAAINLKTIEAITIRISGRVRIGDYSWAKYGYVEDSKGNYIRTYGIYKMNSGSITITGGDLFSIYSTDSAIYCNSYLTISDTVTDFMTVRTAAIYNSVEDILITGGAEVHVRTTSLGSIYKSYNSSSDYSNDKSGSVQLDSMAAVISGGDYFNRKRYGIRILNGSSLYVDANTYSLNEDYHLNIVQNKITLDNGRVFSDERSFYGIWSEGSDIYVEGNSTLEVKMTVSNGQRAYIDSLNKSCYFRTIAVNASNVYVKDSNLVAEMQPSNNSIDEGLCGHEADIFYDEMYTYFFLDKEYFTQTNNRQYDSKIHMTGASSIMSKLAEKYSDSNGNDDRENQWHHVLDKSDFKFYENYNDREYYILNDYKALDYGDGRFMYMYLKSYEKGSDYYLKKEGNNYYYSEYFDFRQSTWMKEGNEIAMDAKGWTGRNIHVKSGDFVFELPENNDGAFFVDNADAEITFRMKDGKRYNGRYDVEIAGTLNVEGDGVIKQLNTVNAYLPYWEGDPYKSHYIEGKMIIKSGTIASGYTGRVYTDVYGGNLAFNETMRAWTAYEGSERKLTRITIDLGEFADKFKWDNIHISDGYSYDTTGIYPVDGKIYLWELTDKLISFDKSKMAFHHLEITDDYTYYVFPKPATDSSGETINRSYTLYRLEERDDLILIGDSEYFTAAGSSLEIDSFCYRKVVDMPLNNTPSYSDSETKTVELPGSRTTTPKNGEYVEWSCMNRFGLSTYGKSSTSFKISCSFDDKSEKSCWDYKCILYSSDGKVKQTYNYDVHVITFTNVTDQNINLGDTAKFNVGYYTEGTWVQDNCVTFGWEMQKNGSDDWTSIGTGSNVLEYAATQDSHLNKFRRVANLPREGKSDIKLVSPAMLINLGVYIKDAPNNVEIYDDLPDDRIALNVYAVNWEEAQWYKKNGDNLTEITGATKPTLTFLKDDYKNESGKWDVSSLRGTYVCKLKSNTFPNEATAEIVVLSKDAPKFTSTVSDVTAIIGHKVEFSAKMDKLYVSKVDADGTYYGDDPDNRIWWEYSTDGGDTWVKVTENNSKKPIYIDINAGVEIISTIKDSNGTSIKKVFGERATYLGSNLYCNDVSADLDQALFRCVMEDKYAQYYSNEAKLTLFSAPDISKQPQSQTVDLKEHSTAVMDFEFETEIPERVSMDYQWQMRAEGESDWKDVNSADGVYRCSGQRLEFLDLSKLESGSINYRCKITVTEENISGSAVIYTDEANMKAIFVPKFKTEAPVALQSEVWEKGYVEMKMEFATPVTELEWQICKDGTNWTTHSTYNVSQKKYNVEQLSGLYPYQSNWQMRCVARYSAEGIVNETISEPTKLPRIRSGDCLSADEMYEAMEKGYTTLKLMQDVTLSSTLDLSDKTMTLDLNGHTLKGNIKLADSTAGTDSILTLIDSDPDAGGVLNGKIELTRGNYGNVSRLYANGGTVTGMVSLNSYVASIYCTSNTPTVFKGYVGNSGEIHGGMFYGSVNTDCIEEKTVTFMNGSSRYAIEVVASDRNVVAPSVLPVKDGYPFEGWYDGDTAYTFGSTLSENITLTAKFGDPLIYDIDYDLGNGKATNQTSYTVESDAITLNNPTKNGYNFTGWSGTDLTGEENMTVTIPTGSIGNRTYAAHYAVKGGYSVAFDTTGGGAISPKTNVKWTDKVLEGITAPTKNGYELTGWKYGNATVTAGTTYADLVKDDTITSITLVAQWKETKLLSGTSGEDGQSIANVTDTITRTNTDKGDIEGSSFAPLKLKATSSKNKTVKLSWSKVSGAEGYIVYSAMCGKTMKAIKTTTGKSYTMKNLKKGKYYKFIVVAYKTLNNKQVVSSISKVTHVAVTGGKYGNATKITLKKIKPIKKGKKVTIKATVKNSKKKVKTHVKLRYESTNTKIATVSSKGVITAKGKGVCYIYVYAQNGVYKQVKVTVK